MTHCQTHWVTAQLVTGGLVTAASSSWFATPGSRPGVQLNTDVDLNTRESLQKTARIFDKLSLTARRKIKFMVNLVEQLLKNTHKHSRTHTHTHTNTHIRIHIPSI